MATCGSLSGDLPGATGPRARLAYYPPGLRQAPHCHHDPHVSVVVAGSFLEATPLGERIICHGNIGFRADESRHAVTFGPAGALILSVDTHDWLCDGRPKAGVAWLAASVRFTRELALLTRRGSEGARSELADRLLDLWAAGRERDPAARGPAPEWLSRAAEQLLAAPEETSIAALARRIGIHRVHFSRSFLRHYGMAPSLFRRRAMVCRALSASLGGEDRLAHAAAVAGFADQSHMSRAVREWCGLSAGELRRLLARGATFVQSGAAELD